MSRDAIGDRALILDRMSKRELIALNRKHYPHAWTAHPLDAWDRASLISRVLDAEFPSRTAVCAHCCSRPCVCERMGWPDVAASKRAAV